MIQFFFDIITHPAFNFASVLIGFLLGDYFAVSRDRRKEFNEAASKFRDAFKGELLALNPSLTVNCIDVADLLKPAFSKHRAAVYDFRHFLKGKRLGAFDQAWRDYYGYDEDQSVTLEFLLKYSGRGYGGEEARSRRALAIANIEKLLEFAAHK
jgi:hypothetical protein